MMVCTPDDLKQILTEVTEGLRGVFGSRLENVILYGSYARGEADEQSDIDIMVLVNDIPRSELWRYRELFNPILDEIEEKWEYEILISVILEDVPTFVYYGEYLPFFRNVMREGISFVREKVS